MSKVLLHIPGARPVVLNDAFDPKTPPKPKQVEIEQEKSKPAGKRK
jgi:hypothetical protein